MDAELGTPSREIEAISTISLPATVVVEDEMCAILGRVHSAKDQRHAELSRLMEQPRHR